MLLLELIHSCVNMTERLHPSVCVTVDRRPRRTLRTASPCSSPPLRAGIPLLMAKNVFFKISPEKNKPHIRVLAVFPGPVWSKLGGKIHLDLRAISGLWERCKSAVFWQTGRKIGLFSIRTEKRRFAGFSCICRNIGKGKGVRIGRIYASLRKDLNMGVFSKIPVGSTIDKQYEIWKLKKGILITRLFTVKFL